MASVEPLNVSHHSESRNTHPFDGFQPQLLYTKGYISCSLTRAFVDFILNQLNLTVFIEQQEKTRFGGDEIYIPTLNAADALRAPGGFTRYCHADKRVDAGHVTRMVMWSGDKRCRSRHYRHYVCVLGMEELPLLVSSPELFANKMMPSEWDYGALVCWHEFMFNRTYGSVSAGQYHPLDEGKYREMPQVGLWMANRGKEL